MEPPFSRPLKAAADGLNRASFDTESTDTQTKESFSNDALSALLSKLQNTYKVVHLKFSEEKETLEARNRYIEITMTRLHETKLTIDTLIIRNEQ